ncbi:hypothetical protein F4809DRAFT_319954 [Biscogniauxia mediterranea]|nr:hypothetical protein F4809DRAFT_319954 [Biscogniauxia mediterranea]
MWSLQQHLSHLICCIHLLLLYSPIPISISISIPVSIPPRIPASTISHLFPPLRNSHFSAPFSTRTISSSLSRHLCHLSFLFGST